MPIGRNSVGNHISGLPQTPAICSTGTVAVEAVYNLTNRNAATYPGLSIVHLLLSSTNVATFYD